MGRLLALARQLEMVNATSPTPPVVPTKASPDDLQPDLLATRVKDLTEPLPVASSILGETVWLVATDQQAAAIQAKGGTAYTPEEVAILGEL